MKNLGQCEQLRYNLNTRRQLRNADHRSRVLPTVHISLDSLSASVLQEKQCHSRQLPTQARIWGKAFFPEVFPMAQWLRICLNCRRFKFSLWVCKSPWRRKWQSTPIFLPGESHVPRSPTGYNPWGHKESDTTETTNTHTRIYVLDVCIHLIFKTLITNLIKILFLI